MMVKIIVTTLLMSVFSCQIKIIKGKKIMFNSIKVFFKLCKGHGYSVMSKYVLRRLLYSIQKGVMKQQHINGSPLWPGVVVRGWPFDDHAKWVSARASALARSSGLFALKNGSNGSTGHSTCTRS